MRLIFVISIIFGICTFSIGNSFCDDLDEDLTDLDLEFNIEELEKKAYSVNADIKILETIKFLDHDTLLFKQKYPDKKKDDTLWQTDLDLTLEGQYQKGIIKLYGRFNGLFYHNEDEDYESKRKAEEAYISFQPSFSLAIDAGKKVHKWGKGYAFSPTAFFARPKDFDDPDASLEGYTTLSIDYVKSMDGQIKTIAITPVIMPVTREINHEIGPKDEFIWGGKLYFFTHDTDIDLMFILSDNMNNRIGIDFSRNLTPSFEIHGDAAWVKDSKQFIMDENGNTSEQEFNALNLLLGLRYLSGQETTYIVEYYRNGQGYSGSEYESYFTFIETGVNQYLSTGSKTALFKSKSYLPYYNRQTAMKNYLYMKISQKDPFDILYFVPAVSIIYNITDKSASITPQATYSPLTNLTFEIKTGFLLGSGKTEYGEKISSSKIILSIQYYF